MVAIRIQSSEDIIKAYFANLGFFDQDLEKIAQQVLDEWNKISSEKEDILPFLDDIIYHKAKEIFKIGDLLKEQLIARFKLCFVLSNSKSKFLNFIAGDLTNDLAEVLSKKIADVAPGYNRSEMKAQKIESPEANNWMHKLFHLWGKN